MIFIGCHVNLSSAHTRPRSNTILVATLLHIGKGIIFAAVSLVYIELIVLFIGIALVECLMARWIWSLRIEAWGVAVGLGIFHIIFPLMLRVSVMSFAVIVGFSVLEISFLAQARFSGYYSFSNVARMDSPNLWQATTIQKRMFNLVALAQLIKAVGMFLGACVIYSYEVMVEPLMWYGIPQVPLVILLGILDLIASIGFHMSRDWGFQLVMSMAGLGFLETMLAWSFPIMLIAVWIITLLTPCTAKWGFYQGFHSRFYKNHQSFTT